jgi:lipoprotein-releasing system permease protein
VLFVFVVSGFGIANVLITIVLQKQHDIAIMKSIGVSRGSIVGIFLLEGIILGCIGAAIGGLAGYVMTNVISSLPISYGESAVVRNDHIVTVQRVYFYVLTTTFSVLMSAVSSVGPARRAARMNPVDILRG